MWSRAPGGVDVINTEAIIANNNERLLAQCKLRRAVLRWAIRQRTGTATGDLLLIRLADMVDTDDNTVQVDAMELARGLRSTRTTVYRTLNDLRRRGYLDIEAQYGAGISGRQPNIYKLNTQRWEGGTDSVAKKLRDLP